MTLAAARTSYVYVVRAVFTDPLQEEAWNAWYDQVHVPDLLGVPGILSATRYRQLGAQGHFLAMYEIESPAVFDHPAYAKITGWGEWAPWIAEWSRSIHRVEQALPTVDYVRTQSTSD